MHAAASNEEQDTLQLKRANWNLKFKTFDFTDLDGFQRYRSEILNRPYLRIGNLGLAARRLDTIELETDLYSIMGDYQPYLYSVKNIQFYQTKKPFTSLHYINGAESEQYFRLLHTQNFNQKGNFSFSYNRITSEGFFVDQFTNHTNLQANYNLRSKNDKFASKALFSLNVLEALENGGIELAENEDPTDNTILLSVNLNEAQSKLRGQYFQAHNAYRFFDNDSSLFKCMSFFHQFAWNKNSRNYEDLVASNVNFYDNEYFNLTNTRDTSFIEELNHQFGITLLDDKLSFAYEMREMGVFQNYIIQDDIYSTYINFSYDDSLANGALSVLGRQGIAGFHQEENKYQLSYDAEFKSINYQILFVNHQQRANPLMSKHRTNHFFFDKEFDLVKRQKFQLLVNHNATKSRIIVSQEILNDFIYLDSSSIPNQHNNALNLLRISIQKDMSFLKHFRFNHQLTYQSISNDDILPLPEFSSSHSLFYGNKFFKGSLSLQLGLDYTFVLSSTGYRYNPALASFHLTNGSQDLPDIHQLDLFMNLGITEAARLFIKMENVLLPTFSEESYFVHNQPIPGRALKVGLYWRMIN